MLLNAVFMYHPSLFFNKIVHHSLNKYINYSTSKILRDHVIYNLYGISIDKFFEGTHYSFIQIK